MVVGQRHAAIVGYNLCQSQAESPIQAAGSRIRPYLGAITPRQPYWLRRYRHLGLVGLRTGSADGVRPAAGAQGTAPDEHRPSVGRAISHGLQPTDGLL